MQAEMRHMPVRITIRWADWMQLKHRLAPFAQPLAAHVNLAAPEVAIVQIRARIRRPVGWIYRPWL